MLKFDSIFPCTDNTDKICTSIKEEQILNYVLYTLINPAHIKYC